METTYIVMLSWLLSLGACVDIGCRNSDGDIVDWFTIYKLPKLSDSSEPLIKQGLGHMYLDVNNQEFVLSDVSLNDTNQAFGHTLEGLKKSSKDEVAYILYNDEHPDGKKVTSHGHTKGVVAFNKDSGFWLIHSVPKFPGYVNGSYFWPSNALEYGQSALCITFSTKEMETVAKQLVFNYPSVYDSNLPDNLLQLAPSFSDVGNSIKSPPWNNLATLTSMKGQKFTSFAKFTKYGDDLYAAWVSPYLKASLWVETWQNGVGKLKSNCTTGSSYNVYNNAEVTLPGGVTFHESKDHSKWTATNETRQIICIGDINRMLSQYHRGGGTVCANLPKVWNQYHSAISSYNKCPQLPIEQVF